MSAAEPNDRPRRPAAQVTRLCLQLLLPVLVIGVAIVVAQQILANIEQPVTQAPPPNIPLVRTITATPEAIRFDVSSQGTVQPRSSVTLSAQVSGRVVQVNDEFRPGGFFAANTTLFTIDDTDYQLAKVQREAEVAQSKLRLAQELAEQELAIRAWKDLEGEREPDALVTRALQVEGARASLAAAEAGLGRALLDLERTKVSLPFAGRVRSSRVNIGQHVLAGQAIAEVYGTAFAEVRLPVPDNEIAFIDLPLAGDSNAADPVVELAAEFAGTTHSWRGAISRTEGEIDRKTRQLILIAKVAKPYAKSAEHPERPPLSAGLFVEARIHGRVIDNVIQLPRTALRADGSVLVVDREGRLRKRQVRVLRIDHQHVQIKDGLLGGDQVCVSAIDSFVDGMPVRVQRAGDVNAAKPSDPASPAGREDK